MQLLELYKEKVLGAMRGFDRVRFRGTLRWLASERGIRSFVRTSGILLKDFGRWAREKTRRARESCERQAAALGIETIYLRSSAVNKEDMARRIAERKGIVDGPIRTLSAVEMCKAPSVEGDRASRKLQLRVRPRKCVHVYCYFDDPEVGFGHVRLRTWLPLSVTICLNGRHWLEKQMRREGLRYVKDGNCFPWVEDVTRVQELLDAQLRTHWPALLNRLARACCPDLPSVLAPGEFPYYWSADETEWASDVMFRSALDLDALYPTLVRHGLLISDSASVMRFLGKRNLTVSGKARGGWPREIVSDLRRRHEGVRVKHSINRNSVKMYNKSASVPRFETTVNDTRDFKVFRPSEDDAKRPASWQKTRKGVSDLHRRAQLSDQRNERYGDAIAAAQTRETLQSVVGGACDPVVKNGKRHRALNPWSAHDLQLLTFLAKGENVLNGFRNKDLRAYCNPQADSSDPVERKRLSGKATRAIRLPRAHGLVRKVRNVKRYVLTAKGQQFVTALLSASHADVKALMEMAA